MPCVTVLERSYAGMATHSSCRSLPSTRLYPWRLYTARLVSRALIAEGVRIPNSEVASKEFTDRCSLDNAVGKASRGSVATAVLSLRILQRHTCTVGMAYSPRSSQSLARVLPSEGTLPKLGAAVRAACSRRKEMSRQLHAAVRLGDAERVSRAFVDGAEVDARNQFGWTALHVAVQQKHLPVVRLLLDLQCDVNATNKVGVWGEVFTPLGLVAASHRRDWSKPTDGREALRALLHERGGVLHKLPDSHWRDASWSEPPSAR